MIEKKKRPEGYHWMKREVCKPSLDDILNNKKDYLFPTSDIRKNDFKQITETAINIWRSSGRYTTCDPFMLTCIWRKSWGYVEENEKKFISVIDDIISPDTKGLDILEYYTKNNSSIENIRIIAQFGLDISLLRFDYDDVYKIFDKIFQIEKFFDIDEEANISIQSMFFFSYSISTIFFLDYIIENKKKTYVERSLKDIGIDNLDDIVVRLMQSFNFKSGNFKKLESADWKNEFSYSNKFKNAFENVIKNIDKLSSEFRTKKYKERFQSYYDSEIISKMNSISRNNRYNRETFYFPVDKVLEANPIFIRSYLKEIYKDDYVTLRDFKEMEKEKLVSILQDYLREQYGESRKMVSLKEDLKAINKIIDARENDFSLLSLIEDLPANIHVAALSISI